MEENNLKLLKIAYLYYRLNYSQQSIAKLFGTTKMSISRYLKQARERKLVKMEVDLPFEIDYQLQEKLKESFRLQNIVVAKNLAKENTKVFLGKIASFHLNYFIKPNDTIGIGIGETIYMLSKFLQNEIYNDVTVFPLIGNSQISLSYINIESILYNFKNKLHCKGYLFPAPVRVKSKEDKEMLLSKGFIYDKTLELWDKCTVMILGIGNISKKSAFVGNIVDALTFKEIVFLKEKKTVGEILANFYDINGNIIAEEEISSKFVGISMGKMVSTKKVIAVAGGKDKVNAIYGALKTGAINMLITDNEAAQGILKLYQKTKISESA
jgi:deoxyribonucleoside regulator